MIPRGDPDEAFSVIDFPRRLVRSMESGADANLSKREQLVVGVISYLVVLASWINVVLDMPYVGAFLAGLLTGVLFYTYRDRVRREWREHCDELYSKTAAGRTNSNVRVLPPLEPEEAL